MTTARLRRLVGEILEADPPELVFQDRLRALARKHGGSIPMTHETPMENFQSILDDGAIRDVDSGIFMTLGHLEAPSFVTGPSARILVSFPARLIERVVPDMRFGGPTDEGYAALLDEFPGLVGAEVGLQLDRVPVDWWFAVEDNETGEPIPFD